MRRGSGPFAAAALVAALVLLVAGIAELFRLRFARGDVFPPYSSLRADPLGARVLHDALADAGVAVSRNFTPLDRIAPPEGALYFIGVSWRDFSATRVDQVGPVIDAVRGGARLIVAFTAKEPEPGPGERAAPGPPPETAPAPRFAELIGVDRLPDPAATDRAAIALLQGSPALPPELAWRSPLRLRPSGEAWRTVYSIGGHAVALERDFGAGTIVLFGDAYWLGNEALHGARRPGLLAWIQGAPRTAVFDESHLGVVESHGVASLARRYGLRHAAVALLVTVLLFVWRNRAPLVPLEAAEAATEGAPAAGRDAGAGLVNLLRRAVTGETLFATMVAEFLRGRAARDVPAETRRALRALEGPAAVRAPLEAIREAHALLRRGPRPPSSS